MKLIMKSEFGSKLYGTATPDSDIDYKGIFIPDARSLVLGNTIEQYTNNTASHNVKNTSDDIDEEFYSLKYFLNLAIKGETIALDMIHTPVANIVELPQPEIWEFIHQNRSKFYTTDMKAYLGYVKKQASKYGIKGTRMAALRQVHEAIKDLPDIDIRDTKNAFIPYMLRVKDVLDKLPINDYCKISTCPKTGNEFYDVMGVKHQTTIKLSELKQKVETEWNKYGERARLAEKNEGVDWKAMHHAIRGGMQLLEIYQTGDLKYPLKDKQFLVDIKQGKIDFKYVSECLESLIADVDLEAQIASKNGMPAKVDQTFWNDFLYEVYNGEIINA